MQIRLVFPNHFYDKYIFNVICLPKWSVVFELASLPLFGALPLRLDLGLGNPIVFLRCVNTPWGWVAGWLPNKLAGSIGSCSAASASLGLLHISQISMFGGLSNVHEEQLHLPAHMSSGVSGTMTIGDGILPSAMFNFRLLSWFNLGDRLTSAKGLVLLRFLASGSRGRVSGSRARFSRSCALAARPWGVAKLILLRGCYSCVKEQLSSCELSRFKANTFLIWVFPAFGVLPFTDK